MMRRLLTGTGAVTRGKGLRPAMAEALASVHGFPVPHGPPLDVEIYAGDVVRLTGPNGSGKTSLLRALAGLEGAIRPEMAHTAQAGFAMQTARDALIGLTVAGEFRLRDRSCPQPLASVHERDVATLSAGEARQVAIHVAMEQGPLLLLDEPSEGLDAAARRRLRDAILHVRQHGAVVVADHGDHWADVADRTVALGRSDNERFAPFTAPPGAPSLSSRAAEVQMGDVTVRIPDLSLGAGFHALVGPNGAGKSVTLTHIVRLDHEARMLPAQARDVLGGDTVADDLQGADPDVVRTLVSPAWMERHPWTLSGGEQQRVALAKVLGKPSRNYLLDEPEAHLDSDGRDALHAVLERRISEGACVLAATHDVGLVAAASSIVSLEASG